MDDDDAETRTILAELLTMPKVDGITFVHRLRAQGQVVLVRSNRVTVNLPVTTSRTIGSSTVRRDL